ncbi:DNA-binding transcriptional regulator, partial [Nonomuraea sp. NPDC049784]
MSRRKTERLLNLVICLLATRRPLSAEQIRHAVPGYDRDGDEAFQRMFERDKNELREIGIPIDVVRDPWEDEPGYRIERESYELPEITLEPDEAAVLGLAAQVWQRASLAEAASGALLKLRAGGVATDQPVGGSIGGGALE